MSKKLLWILTSLPMWAFAMEDVVVTKVNASESSAQRVEQASLSTSSNVNQVRTLVKPETNIKEMDNAVAKLAKLNRELQLAKIKKEINQAAGDDTLSGKTVVTGVMIQQNGKRVASLRFPDGGSLDVEVGAKVKRYRVSEISLDGVRVVEATCRSGACKSNSLFFERVYDSTQYSGMNTQIQKGVNRPTKLEAEGGDVMVPPIVGN